MTNGWGHHEQELDQKDKKRRRAKGKTGARRDKAAAKTEKKQPEKGAEGEQAG